MFLTDHDAVDHAKAVAESSGVAWRAPNIKELSSVVDTRVKIPAVDRLAFPGFGGGSLHTSTSWADNPVYSWRVEFGRGGINRDFWGGQSAAGTRRRLINPPAQGRRATRGDPAQATRAALRLRRAADTPAYSRSRRAMRCWAVALALEPV